MSQLPEIDAMRWVAGLEDHDLRYSYAEALDVLTGVDVDPTQAPVLFDGMAETDADPADLAIAVMLEAAGRWATIYDDRNV